MTPGAKASVVSEPAPYSIEQHKHISAAWDAATSARASPLCRFTVSDGREILEHAGFTAAFRVADLPTPDRLDGQHAKWRRTVIAEANKLELTFTHGVAAKLINCYLKDRFVCGGDHKDERVKCLHPPIDAVLLDSLAKANFGGVAKQWRWFHDARWSKFDSDTYQDVIDLIRKSLQGKPLWMIEKHWQGNQ